MVAAIEQTIEGKNLEQNQMKRSSNWFLKYGKWSLLFAWLPIVGDPLTFVAGTMRIRFLDFFNPGCYRESGTLSCGYGSDRLVFKPILETFMCT